MRRPLRTGGRHAAPRILGAMAERATFRVKRGLAEMLKGGVIMDVTTAEQARIAEDAGAVAVMALERVPADIRADGGVARMASPRVIKEIQEAVTIPVMAKARIGHFAEAQVLQSLEVDYVDESEVLTPADEANHIDKHAFEVPFVCGATNLGEALRRIGEGAAMIRSKGEAGTGNIVEAVRHLRGIVGGIRRLGTLGREQLAAEAKELGAPLEVVEEVAESGWLPVPLFCAGGIATPGRRGAGHAARRRGQLRRLGDLQVRGPGAARAGDRRGDHPLQRSRAGRRGLDRARRADARRRHRRSSPPRASCCSSAGPEVSAERGCRRPSAARPAPAADRRAGQPGRLRRPRRDAALAGRRAGRGAHARGAPRTSTRSSSPAARARRSRRRSSATASSRRSAPTPSAGGRSSAPAPG